MKKKNSRIKNRHRKIISEKKAIKFLIKTHSAAITLNIIIFHNAALKRNRQQGICLMKSK